MLSATVREGAADIAQWELRVRADEPDAVHQMRVAARTLRSVLQVYSLLFEPAPRTAVAAALRRIGRRLAPTRDGEVVAEIVVQRLIELPSPISGQLTDSTRQHLRSSAIGKYDSARAELLALRKLLR